MSPGRPRSRRPETRGARLVNFLLLAGAAILWGSSAIVTGHQAGYGEIEVSVGYRMLAVSLFMFCFCLAAGTPMKVRGRDRPFVALQGVLFFALAFISFYRATTTIPSGVAALILSTSTLFAALIGRAFLGTQLSGRMIAGILCGIGGLVVVVAPQLMALQADPATLSGFAWAASAATCTGAGTVAATRNQNAGIATAALIGWGAGTGGLFALALAALNGERFFVSLSPLYFADLLYLAIVASCLTFFMYFSLVRRVGPAIAAYTLALVPVVAILLSVLFEDLALTGPILAGIAFILAGNVLVLTSARNAPRRDPAKEGGTA
ncbi:DMT family transporter [Afifella sp. IM 167]|uniref:DMT family transporter n=1 Tax=Afifella sp. IM 167 TaxID=2033586 RepID=UPI001CCD5F66|nr:DMT family transporter [Afifella sp. IM 167]MBZ8134949.1 EamA family transporter [Afifella sp. IM 167]